MQSPRWDQEAATLRADARKDYGGFPRRTKDVFKQKTQRFRLPNLTDSQMLVLSTTVVYFLTVCLYYFAFFRHAKVVLFFTAASLLSCPAFAMLNGKRRFEVSLAACCGVAVLLGAIAGLYSYANFGFFSWKLFTSRIATALAAAAVQPFCRRKRHQARRTVCRVLAAEEGEFAKPFPFSAVVGQEEIKLALLLNLVDPSIGGVMISGERGTGKSTTVRGMVRLLPEIEYVEGDPYNSDPQDVSLMSEEVKERLEKGEKLKTTRKRTPFVELPLGATEDRVTGTIDIERALKEAGKAFEPGILARVNRGILYIDECNLLDDQLVDVLLDSAAGGVNTVEREGVSVRHPARFVLIGTSHPDEGDLRPQLLDRFGLTCSIRTALAAEKRMEVLSRAYEWSQSPEKIEAQWASTDEAFKDLVVEARERLKDVKMPRELALKISKVCSKLNVDGLRGDIVTNRAARALAALERRTEVDEEDVRRVTVLCLQHRLRKDVVSDTLDNTALVVKVLLQEFGKGPPPVRPVMRFLEPVAA